MTTENNKKESEVMKYNSRYPSEVTYTSDKNFDVRLKVLIEKRMREFGYETMNSKFNEFIGFFGCAEQYLFDQRIPATPSSIDGKQDELKAVWVILDKKMWTKDKKNQRILHGCWLIEKNAEEFAAKTYGEDYNEWVLVTPFLVNENNTLENAIKGILK